MPEKDASRTTDGQAPGGLRKPSSAVSAVIPVFNNRHMLPDAIASVRSQSRTVEEIIVVDDGSTDGSAEVAAGLGARVLRLPENRGPSAARNAALRAAEGDFVAFLDADDTWAPNHCTLLTDTLARHPHAALITSGTRNDSPVRPSQSPRPPIGEPFDALPYLVRDNFVTQSAAVVRRDMLLRAGGYDERMRFSEDYDLWLRLALEHPMIALSDVTVVRRLHEGQVTWKNEAPLYSESWRLRLALLDSPRLHSDAHRLDRVLVALRDAVDLEFEFTWRDLDATSFAIVEAAANQVPGTARSRRHWRRKRMLLWHGWVSAVKLRRAIRRAWRRGG